MPNSEQLLDIFTKILPCAQQNYLLSILGMVSSHSNLRGVKGMIQGRESDIVQQVAQWQS